ncbi:hypothetical protein PTKIN_Ptkin04bG0059700 [Pterospermum kingtungense]
MSRFFSRTISYLTSRRHSLYLLCLSIGNAFSSLSGLIFLQLGNADGVGSIRKDELYRASAVLRVVFYQVQLQRVKVLDHPDLQDGCRQVWNHDLLAKIIEEEVYSHGSHGIDVVNSWLLFYYRRSSSRRLVQFVTVNNKLVQFGIIIHYGFMIGIPQSYGML